MDRNSRKLRPYDFHWSKDMDKILEDLKDEYRYMEKQVDLMRQRLIDWNKDETIQKLEKEKDDLYKHSLLQLSDKELKDIREFQDKHYETCCGNGKYKSKGNTWRYEISGTGIGHIIKVQCPECNTWLDITDIDSW
jgi:hypothetical protein